MWDPIETDPIETVQIMGYIEQINAIKLPILGKIFVLKMLNVCMLNFWIYVC